jgi:DNA invertase Pin-like site-specific DNA recombinase
MFNVNDKRVYSDINAEISNKKSKISKNAIIYCRVSTKNQSFGTSLESQQLFCQEYCLKNNINIKSVINETNSAKLMSKQIQLNNFLDSNKNINLIVYEPSRLSRNFKDSIQFADTCSKKNIIIHFVQDNLVSSNSSDLKKILSGIIDGETESKNIGLRVKRSIIYRKMKGTYKPSISKYGYKYIKQKSQVYTVINCKEQKIINLIKKLYWGSNIKIINKLLFEITGINHELYFIYDIKPVEEIKYGNMLLIDIVNFLNSISITRRNKKWNSNTISQIVK